MSCHLLGINIENVRPVIFVKMVSHVDFLANIIIQQYFINARCLIIISDDFNYQGGIPSVKINNCSQDFFQYFGCQDVIIKTQTPVSSFQLFEKLIRLNVERFNERKYLILPSNNMTENLTDIFKSEEISYVSNLLIVSEQRNVLLNGNCYDILSNKYVGQSGNNEMVLMDMWFADNRSFLMGNNLFPDKLINQMGKELRMATFQYEPYSVIGDTIDSSFGSEMKTVLSFAKKYNMTARLVINEEDYWGVVYKNWSGIGLLGNLVTDKADLGFSALYTWEDDYYFLDLSKPLVRTGITCLVPAPKLAAGYFTPMYAFTGDLWLLVGAFFLLTITVATTIMTCYSGNSVYPFYIKTQKDKVDIIAKMMLNTFKSFLLQTITKNDIPKGIVGQYFFGVVFLFTLILAVSYDSSFASVMTIPRYQQAINTVDDFATSGLQWGGTQDAWVVSIQNTKEEKYIKIVSRFQALPEDNLREKSKTGQYAFSLERLPKENFAIGAYIKEDVIQNFHVMREDFYWEQCVIMTRKNSVLLPMLDMFILRVFEAGLISYWQNEAASLSMDQVVQRAVKYYYHHLGDRTVSKLKIVHVEGAFALLLIGYLLSFLVFIVEIVVYKMHRKQYYLA